MEVLGGNLMDKMICKAIDSERIAIDMIATEMIEASSFDERYEMKKEQLDKAVDVLATAKKIDYEKAYKRGKRRGIIVGAIGIIGTIAFIVVNIFFALLFISLFLELIIVFLELFPTSLLSFN